ncbi:hypothetical protein IEQ34_007036 [Dendrobium chrysotoxum]|uniref:Uncharacterized protein n=1 Tax=Dendrobium chrysotoxum TaxID=161865 RepID=A0AAV7GQX2_DENCH|nr:hypothetical protein IEQ34_007036 [Dendrobium chrysotoxum]
MFSSIWILNYVRNKFASGPSISLPYELIDISTTCGVSISQFLYRVMSIIIGLNLIEKLGKLKELTVPLHIGEEYILRAIKIPNVDNLIYEIRYLNKYI